MNKTLSVMLAAGLLVSGVAGAAEKPAVAFTPEQEAVSYTHLDVYKRQAQEREAMRAARRKPAPEPVYRKVMPLADALALLKRCWPALVTDGQPQLLAVNIREAMVNDIRRRGLEISVKTLKRCLAAVTRSDAYLGAMTVGAWRKNLAGEPVAAVSAEEAAYAVERRAQEHAKRQRRAVRSVATRARNELITTEKRKTQDEHE
ncbi:fertility inhibition protein FinO [Enterobacter kobei]|uniref:fertility inhibition protein FinO n=1 Tax=Enterobacter kobei TaxID=208224 RepID=UPI001D00B817|nr:fertility inhibition protein FinO [Enterobacter kobei]